MMLKIKRQDGLTRIWVAKTVRGFNAKQRKEIAEFRGSCKKFFDSRQPQRILE